MIDFRVRLRTNNGHQSSSGSVWNGNESSSRLALYSSKVPFPFESVAPYGTCADPTCSRRFEQSCYDRRSFHINPPDDRLCAALAPISVRIGAEFTLLLDNVGWYVAQDVSREYHNIHKSEAILPII
jgi:hypothetical protein